MTNRLSQSHSFHRIFSALRRSLQILLMAGITLITGLSAETQAGEFQLFDHHWRPGLIQKTKHGWQHIYFCQNCRLTPSLAVITSTESVPDSSLFDELERAYDSVAVEGDILRGQQSFTLIRATEPRSKISPKRVSTIVTRFKSLTPGLWHFVEAIVEADNEDDENVAEDLWLNMLGHSSLNRHSLTMFPQDTSVAIDISSPDRNWFSDFVEQVGVDKLILGSTVTTTGLLLLGAQIVLGAANVKGPCGKPLGQCDCTKNALRAGGLPVI